MPPDMAIKVPTRSHTSSKPVRPDKPIATDFAAGGSPYRSWTLLGLGDAADTAIGRQSSAGRTHRASAFYGAAQEISTGKDTPSGHWEIAAVPVPFDWGYFPQTVPTFPQSLTDAIIERGEVPGVLGNRHASGTEIIEMFGEEHIQSGKPICYTSSDSVIQIAAHEQHFGLDRLYELCLVVRELVDPLNIGRVIARPFVGEAAGDFERTANRRDFAVPPPEPTLLDRLTSRGSKVIGVGKIGDIFAHRGVSEVRKAAGNMALFDAALGAMRDAGDGDLVFANFVDFDTLFGHRRDVAGYAAALEAFDRKAAGGPGLVETRRSAPADRRPWLRSDLAGVRSHAGTGPRLRGGARAAGRRYRDATDVCRHRRDRGRPSRPAGWTPRNLVLAGNRRKCLNFPRSRLSVVACNRPWRAPGSCRLKPADRILRFPLPTDLSARLEGRKIISLGRRAKYLTIQFEGGPMLICHLGMSGSFRDRSRSRRSGTRSIPSPALEGCSTRPHRVSSGVADARKDTGRVQRSKALRLHAVCR